MEWIQISKLNSWLELKPHKKSMWTYVNNKPLPVASRPSSIKVVTGTMWGYSMEWQWPYTISYHVRCTLLEAFFLPRKNSTSDLTTSQWKIADDAHPVAGFVGLSGATRTSGAFCVIWSHPCRQENLAEAKEATTGKWWRQTHWAKKA